MRYGEHSFPERPPSQLEIDEFAESNGYFPHFGALLPRPVTRRVGYQVVFLVPTVADGAQLIIAGLSQVEGVHERYDYGHLFDAIVAYGEWRGEREFEGEPLGWLRHKPSNRRRAYTTPLGVGVDWTIFEETVRE